MDELTEWAIGWLSMEKEGDEFHPYDGTHELNDIIDKYYKGI